MVYSPGPRTIRAPVLYANKPIETLSALDQTIDLRLGRLARKEQLTRRSGGRKKELLELKGRMAELVLFQQLLRTIVLRDRGDKPEPVLLDEPHPLPTGRLRITKQGTSL